MYLENVVICYVVFFFLWQCIMLVKNADHINMFSGTNLEGQLENNFTSLFPQNFWKIEVLIIPDHWNSFPCELLITEDT